MGVERVSVAASGEVQPVFGGKNDEGKGTRASCQPKSLRNLTRRTAAEMGGI